MREKIGTVALNNTSNHGEKMMEVDIGSQIKNKIPPELFSFFLARLVPRLAIDRPAYNCFALSLALALALPSLTTDRARAPY